MGKKDHDLARLRDLADAVKQIAKKQKDSAKEYHHLMERTRSAVGEILRMDGLLTEVPWLVAWNCIVPANRNARAKLVHGRCWKILKAAGMIEQVIPLHVGPFENDRIYLWPDKDYLHITLFRNGYNTCGTETPEQKLTLVKKAIRFGLSLTTTSHEKASAHADYKRARAWHTLLNRLPLNE